MLSLSMVQLSSKDSKFFLITHNIIHGVGGVGWEICWGKDSEAMECACCILLQLTKIAIAISTIAALPNGFTHCSQLSSSGAVCGRGN